MGDIPGISSGLKSAPFPPLRTNSPVQVGRDPPTNRTRSSRPRRTNWARIFPPMKPPRPGPCLCAPRPLFVRASWPAAPAPATPPPRLAGAYDCWHCTPLSPPGILQDRDSRLILSYLVLSLIRDGARRPPRAEIQRETKRLNAEVPKPPHEASPRSPPTKPPPAA